MRRRRLPAVAVATVLAACAAAFAAEACADDEIPAVSAEALAMHDYKLTCMGCHQADGSGVAGKIPSLRGMDRLLDSAAGREYLVRVPGIAQSGLSDERLVNLINWTLAEFGERPFRAYTVAEVAPLRRRPLRSDVAFDVSPR